MSKRDYEKKIREEQEATAHVFQEFISAFQDAPGASKTFVKSGVLYADKNQLKPLGAQLYNPTPLVKCSTAIQNALECAKILKDTKPEKLKKNKEKPKSNLELLKEELKLRHSEKDERDRLKEEIIMAGPALSYFEGGDPNSTNLFVASLNTKITEANLMEEFGAYGPLASVKIMWPRGEERFKNLNTNCGFVAFMSRRDAERALNQLKHRTDMRVGWGKSVELPVHPIYIPQELLRFYLPPAQTGLPFNAQPGITVDSLDDLEDVLFKSIVKVTIPLNKKVLTLVNRMVEFVVKEGPLFEAMVMNNELRNPDYTFLFDNKSPIHVYYRWKLFSILQGESTREWSMKPFRMFKGGSIWMPPVAHNYLAGMPEELINNKDNSALLSENQCERWVEIIQNLTLNRESVAEAMVFCLNHLSAIDDSLDVLVESLCHSSTKPPSKIARLYLLSDVLSNCITKNVNFSNNMQSKIETIMEELRNTLTNITRTYDKSLFRSKVMRVVRHIDSIGLLPIHLVKKYEDYFTESYEPPDEGTSSSDEPLDGASLLKRSLKNSSDECVITPSGFKVKQDAKNRQEYFVPSKWDAVDPEEVEAQSMSSTKLYYMELETDRKKEDRESKSKYSPTSSKTKCKKRKSESEENSPERRWRKHKEKKKKSGRR